MKKKIISFLVMFCMVFPCFFAVACKSKKDPAKAAEPYTYSVVLKNAKGLIDENSLQSEYDYEKQENVGWTSEGNDFSISVTRKSTMSSSLDVSLLEGYDYSNVSITVNDKAATAQIKSGDNSGCENKSYLTDREFHYAYENMKSDTSLVVDFQNCAWSKVSLDVSELASQGIKTFKVSEDFITILDDIETSFTEIDSTSVEVDYGTVLAFNCGQTLVFKADTSRNFQDLSLSKYASKYYTQNDNIIQYFTAKQDGDVVVYNATKDFSNFGTLRMMSGTGLLSYSSLENLVENISLNYSVEKETYGGSLLKLDAVSSDRLFVKLDAEAQNFNYYVVNSIDEYLLDSKIVEQKTLDGTEIKYLDINIADLDGSIGPVKYLLRKPKVESDYYVVYAKDFTDSTRISNADYVLVGADNRPTSSLPATHQGNIFFGFLKSSLDGVEIELSKFTSNKVTDFVQRNESVAVNADNFQKATGMIVRSMDTVVQNEIVNSINIHCYESTDALAFYDVMVDYTSENFTNAEVSLDTTDFELYNGEKVFYTTNINDDESWRLLTAETSGLTISSARTDTIYYYFESNRVDALLQIVNANDEVVSVTGELKDCFGRKKHGEINVLGSTINLSKVCYLDIKPGEYSAYTAKLLREYEQGYHNVSLDGLGSNLLMISQNGVDFGVATSLSVKYNGQGTNYYYIDSETNKFLVLKNAGGEVVGYSENVVKANNEFMQINGKFVYTLVLVGDYYADGEQFNIVVEEATYGLVNSTSQPVDLYLNSERTGEVQHKLSYGTTYYFVGNAIDTYLIIDEKIKIVISEIEIVSSDIETVFAFTLEFPEDTNYVDGTTFTLRVAGE